MFFFCFFGRSTFIFWGKERGFTSWVTCSIFRFVSIFSFLFCFFSFCFFLFVFLFVFRRFIFPSLPGGCPSSMCLLMRKRKKEKSILNCSPQITIRFICRPNVDCLTRHWNLIKIDICSISIDCCLWKYKKINWNCCISNIIFIKAKNVKSN